MQGPSLGMIARRFTFLASPQPATAGRRLNMQVPLQYTETIQIVVLLVAIAIVAFWRIVVKWLIMLVSIVTITTLGFGLIMIWQTTHHTVA